MNSPVGSGFDDPGSLKYKISGVLVGFAVLAVGVPMWVWPVLFSSDDPSPNSRKARGFLFLLDLAWSRPVAVGLMLLALLVIWGSLTNKAKSDAPRAEAPSGVDPPAAESPESLEVTADPVRPTIDELRLRLRSARADEFGVRRAEAALAPGDFATAHAGTMRISDGRTEGTLAMRKGSGEDIESGRTLLVFDFLDSSGNPWRHWSYIALEALWPRADEVATPCEPPGAADFAIKELRDTRDLFRLRLSDGRTLEGSFKYTDITCRVNVRGDRLDVFHTALIEGDYITFKHEVPVERLLWRRGPSDYYGEGCLIPETAESVFIERLDEAPHLAGLRPSPITVVESNSSQD